ncbi:hypothetical protein L9F63_017148, partial [Diploptera punctata]
KHKILALDLAQNSNVQDAFVIAVEQQARERLERLSALKRIKPVDMTKLSQQLNQQTPATEQELNGFIESSPIYVTSISNKEATPPSRKTAPGRGVKVSSSTEEPEEIELKQDLSEEVVNKSAGRQDSTDSGKLRTTAVVESNNNNCRKLAVADEGTNRNHLITSEKIDNFRKNAANST